MIKIGKDDYFSTQEALQFFGGCCQVTFNRYKKKAGVKGVRFGKYQRYTQKDIDDILDFLRGDAGKN